MLASPGLGSQSRVETVLLMTATVARRDRYRPCSHATENGADCGAMQSFLVLDYPKLFLGTSGVGELDES